MKAVNNNWHSIIGYEGYYEINNTGVVKSLERKIKVNKRSRKISSTIMKVRINNCGYAEVRLTKNKISKTTFIHILLAKVFIPNPTDKPEVNHINGNKLDNRLINLEWVTHSENMKHAYENGLIKKAKQVIDTCSGKEFSSTREAAKVYGINFSTLKNYLNGCIKINPTCLQYKNAA